MLRQNLNPMEQINRFVGLAPGGSFHLTDRCEQFGITCKTGGLHLAK